MERIFNILARVRPELDFHSSEDFITDEMLDSFDIVMILAELEDVFNISINAMDIVPENLCNVETIANLIRKNGGTV
jgi:acyl carrier protein